MSDNASATRKVLVVDDHSIMRIVLSSMLISRGYAVTEADSAEAALPRLRAEPFDLVMLDIMMPGMSGIALCHLIRQDLGLTDLPVVAYTALGTAAQAADTSLHGFDGFLIKPVDGATLDAVLENVAVCP